MKTCIAAFLDSSKIFCIDIIHECIIISGYSIKFKVRIIGEYDDDIFWCKDEFQNDFVIYRITNHIYQCIDVSKQFICGMFKHCADWFEIPGCLIDERTNTMWYRIAKNGSSCLMRTYSTDKQWFSDEQKTKFVHLNDIKKIKVDNFSKYFVFRDTESRMRSQVSNLQRLNGSYPRIIVYSIFNSISKITDFLVANYTVDDTLGQKINNLEQEIHVAQQSKWLKKYINTGLSYDFYVNLDELHFFVEKYLGVNFEKKSIMGFNKTVISFSSQVRDKLRRFISQDYAFINNIREFDKDFIQ